MKLNGSQIVLECLKEQGVDTIFGYPGGAILNIYDELYKQRDHFRHVLLGEMLGAPFHLHAPPHRLIIHHAAFLLSRDVRASYSIAERADFVKICRNGNAKKPRLLRRGIGLCH